MKRKLICTLLILALLLSISAAAASPAVRAANALYTMGLFNGIGQHSDGSPIYALDRSLTRQEAVVLLVRLLGQEQEALTAGAAHPFADVADWAAPYVALAYEKGYVEGISDTELNAAAPMDERGWLTMLLRALGYADVSYEDPWTLAGTIGLTDHVSAGFTRASAVTLSLTALGLPTNGSRDTLLYTLLQSEAVTEQEVRDAGMTEALSRRPLSAREVSARCADAVVFLQMYDNDTALESETPSATASGFFVAADGVLLTNYHAVGETMYAFATTIDGERYAAAEVLFADKARDIAVLRLDPTELNSGEVTAAFPWLPMRSVETVQNGDIVYAIGSPLGLINSISDGIVANRSRMVSSATGSPDPYIQLTAAISHGSSGGVLLNEYGEAIGITTAAFVNGQNLNLAVPLDLPMTLDLTAKGTPYAESFEGEPSPYADAAVYEAYPEVPDFGAVIGAEPISVSETNDGCVYLYDNALANDSALAEYYEIMYAWGYSYSFDVEHLRMVFTNAAKGLTVYGEVVSFSEEAVPAEEEAEAAEEVEETADSEETTEEDPVEEVKYYQIRIIESVVDTTSLRSDLFPWTVE